MACIPAMDIFSDSTRRVYASGKFPVPARRRVSRGVVVEITTGASNARPSSNSTPFTASPAMEIFFTRASVTIAAR